MRVPFLSEQTYPPPAPLVAPLSDTPPTSAVLEDLLAAFPQEKISVGALIDRLQTRAHAVLLLVLALPMCIPNVPGVSTIFGVLMIAPAIQVMLGHKRLWLPRRARAIEFPRASLEAAFGKAIPLLKRLEYLIKPRFCFLTTWPSTTYIGAQCLLMALILILPIWGANLTPGITVVLTSLALLQRDGIVMLFSVPAAVGSAAWVYFGAKLSIAAASWIFDGAAHLWSMTGL